MTRADRRVIAVLALLALAAWPVAAALAAGPADQVIITGPAGRTTVSLAEDAEFVVVGATGTVVVRVEDGAVRVASSECPDQTCVRTGAVSSGGAIVACVPNGVVLRVGGAQADGLDARIR